MALVTHLPKDSAVALELDPQPWQWSDEVELLVGILERMDAANYMYLKVHAKPGTTLPLPITVPRPQPPAPKGPPKPSTTDELRRFYRMTRS